MQNYHLAIDIGASSGRLVLGWREGDQILTEEVYRFNNGIKEKNGHLCWPIRHIFDEILIGLKRCASIRKIPTTLGIDTWGVDFVLFNDDENVEYTVSYRDARTQGIPENINKVISEDELYRRTGIQKQDFNTIYQLCADNETKKQHLLMIPDYLNYLLTGERKQEYTNASTTGLINLETRTWDISLIEALGLPKHWFLELSPPGKSVGHLKQELINELGFDVEVIHVASHDTASAVIARPNEDQECAFISSGTWSLMGDILAQPINTETSRITNFTNEGGISTTVRYLKNIMGLWMIQCLKTEIAPDMSFAELIVAAQDSTNLAIVDCNDSRFFTPKNMAHTIKTYCIETDQITPETIGDYAQIIYRSLATKYAQTLFELESHTGKKYEIIQVIGGGANADYLNALTAELTGTTITAGPIEATAIGNILVQMEYTKTIENIKAGTNLLKTSFPIKRFISNRI